MGETLTLRAGGEWTKEWTNGPMYEPVNGPMDQTNGMGHEPVVIGRESE